MSVAPTSTINNEPNVNIEMHNHGLTSEKFLQELPRTMQGAIDKSLTDYNDKRNNAAKALGITGRRKW